MANAAQVQTTENAFSSDSEEGSETECYGTRINRLDAAERQELRDRGIVVREGAWTGLEDERLKKNMRHICKKYGIDDPRKLIFADDYPDEAKEIRKLFDEELIHMKLRKGIQRPVYNVYIRARKIFDPQNYLGRFSNEEVHRMKNLAMRMGTRWSQIAKKMGRSGRSLCDRFKISGNGNSGFWSDEERERLVRVVKELSGFNQDHDVEKLFFNIPWVKVGDAMETRNVHQCRMEWIHIVSWVAADYQTRYTSKGRWNVEDNIRLIEKVYNMDIHDEQDIDWMALLDDFPRVPSPQKLTYYWYRLKVKYVHNYRFKTYEDIVCHLHDTKLPELREKLNQRGQKIVSREIVDEESDSGGDETQAVNERNVGQSDGVSMTTSRGISNESRTERANEQGQEGEDTEEGRHNGHDEMESEERNDRRRTKKRKKRARNEHETHNEGDSNVENRIPGRIPKKIRIEKVVIDNSLEEEERITDTRKEKKKKKKKKKKRLSDSEIPG
ncbi:transcription termination factor 1 [Strongylocentrotus purpuratus]|uniref:Myb-like domain-containing protein n=1 Tax=Strongylocentrotus purpuratus TaxID=7668 RepID=A0A7M7PFR7_STRPU|nr:transcription termination factor 1 [Strongylocentrotus purpuratus]